MPRSFGGAALAQRFTIPGGTFDMSGDFTHMLWFRCTGFEEAGYHPYVISSGALEDNNTLNIFLGHGDDPDDFRISIRDGSNAGTNFITDTPDGPSEHIGEWIPVVITRSGTTLTVMLFAREGDAARTTTATMAGTVSLGTSTVGARDTGPDRYFLGEIAHRSHFTEALSNAAIDDLFAGVNPQQVRDDYEAALARYFPFDQASGDETDVVSGTVTATAFGDPGPGISTDPVSPYATLAPDHYEITEANGTALGPFVVGVPRAVRITAFDDQSEIETDFTGTVALSSTGSLIVGGGTTPAFVNGVLAAHMVAFGVPGESITLSVLGPSSGEGTSAPFNVQEAMGGYAIPFRGIRAHLEFMLGWGYGVPDENEASAEILRISRPALPDRFSELHYLPIGRRGTPIVSVQSFGSGAIIFKENETYWLTGNTRASWGHRRIDPNYGLAGDRLSIVHGGRCYFWSMEGPRRFSGDRESEDLAFPLSLRRTLALTSSQGLNSAQGFVVRHPWRNEIEWIFGRVGYVLNIDSEEWTMNEYASEPLGCGVVLPVHAGADSAGQGSTIPRPAILGGACAIGEEIRPVIIGGACDTAIVADATLIRPVLQSERATPRAIFQEPVMLEDAGAAVDDPVYQNNWNAGIVDIEMDASGSPQRVPVPDGAPSIRMIEIMPPAGSGRILALDTFTDTDGTPITSHTPDAGFGGWLGHSTGADGACAIFDNQLRTTTAPFGGRRMVFATAPVAYDKFRCYTDITVANATGITEAGIAFRLDTGRGNIGSSGAHGFRVTFENVQFSGPAMVCRLRLQRMSPIGLEVLTDFWPPSLTIPDFETLGRRLVVEVDDADFTFRIQPLGGGPDEHTLHYTITSGEDFNDPDHSRFGLHYAASVGNTRHDNFTVEDLLFTPLRLVRYPNQRQLHTLSGGADDLNMTDFPAENVDINSAAWIGPAGSGHRITTLIEDYGICTSPITPVPSLKKLRDDSDTVVFEETADEVTGPPTSGGGPAPLVLLKGFAFNVRPRTDGCEVFLRHRPAGTSEEWIEESPEPVFVEGTRVAWNTHGYEEVDVGADSPATLPDDNPDVKGEEYETTFPLTDYELVLTHEELEEDLVLLTGTANPAYMKIDATYPLYSEEEEPDPI